MNQENASNAPFFTGFTLLANETLQNSVTVALLGAGLAFRATAVPDDAHAIAYTSALIASNLNFIIKSSHPGLEPTTGTPGGWTSFPAGLPAQLLCD